MQIKCKYDQLVSPKNLKPHDKNRNKHPKEQIDRLSKLIEYQGIRAPIVVSKLSDKIVKGHGTLMALQQLKIKEVPVVYQDFDNEDQEYAFLQSDNAIASWAELDFSGINADIEILGPDFDIDLLGIKDFTIDAHDKEKEAIEDEVPEIDETKTISKLGDIYELGEHRLMCGDSTDKATVELLMNGEKADMVFTDPPYGVSYQKKVESIDNQSKTRQFSQIANDDIDPKEIFRSAFVNLVLVMQPDCSFYVTAPQGGDQMMMMMMMMKEAGMPCRHELMWLKNAPVFSMGRLDYDYKHEPILYGWNKKHTFRGNGQFKNSVWEISREPNKLHPTMKPISLIENALNNSSDSGNIVLDLFGGSGSTLIACEKTKRKCFMCELDPHYIQVIIERWMKYTGRNDVYLLNDDGTKTIWSDVCEKRRKKT